MANIASKFGSTEDFNELLGLLKTELRKEADPIPGAGGQTVGSTEDIIEIDYDPILQTRLVSEAPFLRFLEEKGRVQNSTSAVIGWRKKENNNTSSFISELGEISEYGGKIWDRELASMKTIIYPLSVSMMAQLGNQNVDLIDDDRQDGYADISSKKDKAMLLGSSDVDANSFDGINEVAENTDDLQGETITMDAVDDMIDNVIAKGGNPDCIVTTARVARQLTREQQLDNLHFDKVEFVPGGWMRSYYTPTGEIPVITDRNLVTLGEGGLDPATEDSLFVVDSSGVINKNLLPISEFQLATTRLAHDSVLATFTAFGVPGPQKQGVIRGIHNGVGEGN